MNDLVTYVARFLERGLQVIDGRGERIRTSDLSVPNRAHYQAVLRPELQTAERQKSILLAVGLTVKFQASMDFKN